MIRVNCPRFSLIIATLDDAGDLEKCLHSLSLLVEPPMFEVIIIDQNADDHVEHVAKRFSHALDIVHRQVDFVGASMARNLGATLARGEWLGFPDDDCELLPDSLKHVARIADLEGAHVISGRTIDDAGNSNVLRWQSCAQVFTRQTMFGCLTEATLFVQRECFLAVNGFDSRFGPGARFPAAEGIELMQRLFEHHNDLKACYDPAVRMRHPSKIPPWNAWAARRFLSYSIGDGALIAKHPRKNIMTRAARMMAGAVIQIAMLRGWKSIAYAARLTGLVRGYISYHLNREHS